jgi:hypothetical protein
MAKNAGAAIAPANDRQQELRQAAAHITFPAMGSGECAALTCKIGAGLGLRQFIL